MGLDTVELILRVEEDFEIEIPNEIAEKLTTPRKFIDYVMSHPKFREAPPPREYIADRIWSIIEDVVGVSRKDYHEDSRIVDDMARH